MNFTRNWHDYTYGFGSADTEYWLGNEFIHQLTSNRNMSLSIQMADIFNGRWNALYRKFELADKNDNYKLHLSGFQGNATDTMTYSENMQFSTFDKVCTIDH